MIDTLEVHRSAGSCRLLHVCSWRAEHQKMQHPRYPHAGLSIPATECKGSSRRVAVVTVSVMTEAQCSSELHTCTGSASNLTLPRRGGCCADFSAFAAALPALASVLQESYSSDMQSWVMHIPDERVSVSHEA